MFYLSRGEQIVVVALLCLLLLGGGVLTYAKGQHAADASSAELLLVAAADDVPHGEITIDIGGAVLNPGIYTLPARSRVADAISVAGGTMPEADTTGLNLARPLQNGGKLFVSSAGSPPDFGKNNFALLSLNSATQQDLELLPGIGPVYAERIIAYRDQKIRESGYGFTSEDELLNIPGIGPRRFVAVKDLVTP